MSVILPLQEELAFAIEAVGEVPCMSAPDLFFVEQDQPMTHANNNLAKKLCAQCPVINICRNYAIEADEAFGVWGGMTAGERRRAKRIHKDGRVKDLQLAATA